ncbi:ABC transporter permease [Virgibacillus sp. AGTR]|uniref:ABC transporter permease n=1 Tax=unclassified Virgibacillus TaxID=2620237 RepID=UPI001964087B|nr:MULTISPECIES: ABC transporter permease subunit [unclassified Virgibacillus]MCC2251519.1 ABC transporter permease [Virgibacillus sp. AGTR]MDY7045365.1 ABC transporter permease subunit [Virgibacillus sp. M23]QRZ19965.1 ABC transporter permease subunit [Virgibacillus sp. AGTR]
MHTKVLLQKEMLENWRNKKWIWVPLVFLLLAIMDPISNYYLPQILESIGGLPDGTVLELPEYAPQDILLMSLGQFSSLGVLLIVLISMGTIAGEQKNGVMDLLLIKPISYRSIILAKWFSLLLLVWTSLFLGITASWYYTNSLYGEIEFLSMLLVTFYYGLWLTLVVTISIFYNAIIQTPGLVAFLTILTTIILSIVTNVFGTHIKWSPVNLSTYIHEMLVLGSVTSQLIATAFTTIVLIIIILSVAIYCFKKKQH